MPLVDVGSDAHQVAEHLIVLDGWARFKTVGRIAALIGFLRSRLDDLLLTKIEHPDKDISTTPEVQALVELLQTDGMG